MLFVRTVLFAFLACCTACAWVPGRSGCVCAHAWGGCLAGAHAAGSCVCAQGSCFEVLSRTIIDTDNNKHAYDVAFYFKLAARARRVHGCPGGRDACARMHGAGAWLARMPPAGVCAHRARMSAVCANSSVFLIIPRQNEGSFWTDLCRRCVRNRERWHCWGVLLPCWLRVFLQCLGMHSARRCAAYSIFVFTRFRK